MFTFINRFTVTGDVEEFERLLGEITSYLTGQPGFLSHRLYQSTIDEKVYVETTEWDGATAHEQAVSGAGFLGPVKQIMRHAKAEPSPFVLRHDASPVR